MLVGSVCTNKHKKAVGQHGSSARPARVPGQRDRAELVPPAQHLEELVLRQNVIHGILLTCLPAPFEGEVVWLQGADGPMG